MTSRKPSLPRIRSCAPTSRPILLALVFSYSPNQVPPSPMLIKLKKKRSAKNAKQKDYKCAGCRRSYTIFGYFQHLRQTSKPDCIKVRDSDSRFRWNSPPPPSTSSSSRSSTPLSDPAGVDHAAREPSPQPFDGDFFGEYDPAEFNDFDEYDGCDEQDLEDRSSSAGSLYLVHGASS